MSAECRCGEPNSSRACPVHPHGDRKDVLDELTRLGQEIEAENEKIPEWSGQWVCVTHARHAPCRGGKNNCVYSCTAESVEAVRRYQAGDAPR